MNNPLFFPATRDHALARAHAFAPHMGRDYASLRNYDFGPKRRENISALSPFVRHRLVLEEELIALALEHHSSSAAEKFIQEVYWRTYWKGWMEMRPDAWAFYKTQVDEDMSLLKGNTGVRKAYDEALNGRTGIDCFDAWTEELREIGYLHNHARMWYASIWIFTLKLPWALGADFLYQHLLDGDPASNTLSWRWVAGLHTIGKNYAARASNIAKYTEERFRPEYKLASKPEPLPADWDLEKEPLPYTPPIQSLEKAGLLITEEDLCPESLSLKQTEICAIASLMTANKRSPNGASPAVINFTNAAMEDAAMRSSAQYNKSVSPLSSATEILSWARDNDLKNIVTAFTPQGPAADFLASLRPALAKAGIELSFIQREWDRKTWPHCAKGFFALKKKIPSLLAEQKSLPLFDSL